MQGLRCSLGNETPASGLMNLGSSHKSCSVHQLVWSLWRLRLLRDPAQRRGGGSAHGRLVVCLLRGTTRQGLLFPLGLV